MNAKKTFLTTVCAAVLAAAFAGAATFSDDARAAAAQPAAAQPAASRAVVAKAVEAIGGAAKVAAIRNITANGYAQYAYMWGTGRLDGSANAPEKYIAANDLKRVYDIENNRFQMLERRTMLFPFLNAGGHSFALNNWLMDGDISWNIAAADGKAVRNPVRQEGVLWNEGLHTRRMWMMNNPVVLLRAMMDPATRLSAPRKEGARTVIDIVLPQGDKLAAGFDADGMPGFVRWGDWHSNFGQVNMTTYFSGWSAWDGQSGVLMPLGFSTRLDWRNVDYFKMYVDAYQVNTQSVAAAPAEVRATPVPPSNPPRNLTSVRAAPGVWRVNNGTTVVEFKDHLVIYEMNGGNAAAKQILAYIRTLAPGKPIRYLIPSHNHGDHTAGVRQAVAEGITIIQRPSTLQQLKESTDRPSPDYPDDQGRLRTPFKGRAVTDHLRLQDETQTLDIYWARNNGHMADAVVGYIPSAKLLMEGDLVTAAYEWQHWPDGFRDLIAYYKLDVERISPVHGSARMAPDILTKAHAEELLSGGTKRAREHCEELKKKDNYHPGCPIQSKYY